MTVTSFSIGSGVLCSASFISSKSLPSKNHLDNGSDFKRLRRSNDNSNNNKNRRRITSRKMVVATKMSEKVDEEVLPQFNRKVVAEKLNGRLAMLGFLSGSGYEHVAGSNYLEQMQDNWAYIVFLSMVIGYATLKTRNLEVIESKPFTTNIELLNGRMAMLGVLCKFVYDFQTFF